MGQEVPADCLLIQASDDLALNEEVFTGESEPVPKRVRLQGEDSDIPLSDTNDYAEYDHGESSQYGGYGASSQYGEYGASSQYAGYGKSSQYGGYGETGGDGETGRYGDTDQYGGYGDRYDDVDNSKTTSPHMVYRSTMIHQGTCTGLVTAIGMSTRVGEIQESLIR